MHEPACNHTDNRYGYPVAHTGKIIMAITADAAAALFDGLNAAEPPDSPDEAEYSDGIPSEPVFEYALAYRWGNE